MKIKDIRSLEPQISWLYLTQALYFFGFFALKSIFVLYLINHHGFSDGQAISLFASYMCLSYGTSLAGSAMADKLLGVKTSILLGGFLSCLGTICLMALSEEYLCLGLAFLSLGMGLTKPNLHTMTGLYFKNLEDPKKDHAYSVSYMAIQSGHMLASIACGAVALAYGWNYGIALVVFSFIAATYLLSKKVRHGQDEVVFSREKLLVLLGSVIGIITLVYCFLIFRDYAHGMMGSIICGSLLYLGWIFYQCTEQERNGMWFIILNLLFFVIIVSLIEQGGSSLTLFIEGSVNRDILGILIPTPAFASFGSMCVVVCSLISVYLSKRYSKKVNSLSWLIKIVMSFSFVSLGFIILTIGSYNRTGLLSPLWVFGSLILQMMGVVIITPTILAVISKNAPLRFKSIMMGYYLATIAYGHFIAGFVAQFSLTGVSSYGTFFFSLGLIPLVVAVTLFFLQSRQLIRVN